MAAFEQSGHTSCAQRGVESCRGCGDALHGFLRALSHRGEILLERARLDIGHLLEVGFGHFVGFERKTKLRETLETAREMIDGVVGDG